MGGIMNTGDILLCSGNSFLSRRIITYNKVVMGMTGLAAELSHVAMVGASPAGVFEATTLNKWCGKKGVQINDFNLWYWNYPGRIWIREGKDTITLAMRALMVSRMNQLVGTKYEHGIPGVLELALAGFKIPWLSNEIAQYLCTKDGIHCSEADGEVLKFAEILLETFRTNKNPPCLWWRAILGLDKYYGKPRQIK